MNAQWLLDKLSKTYRHKAKPVECVCDLTSITKKSFECENIICFNVKSFYNWKGCILFLFI